MRYKKEMGKSKKKEQLDTGYALPFILVLAVIPLLTMMGTYRSGIGEYSWASGSSFYDFFLVYKSVFLMIVGVLVVAFSIMFWYSGSIRKEILKGERCPLVLVGIFFLFSLVSALMAKEKGDALFGGYEQMEGLVVVIAYVACFFFIAFLVKDEKWIVTLLHALVVGSLILSLLGALQAVGIDYLTSKSTFPFFTMFMKNLPEGFEGISASFGKGVSYATLYNPNYVGTYVALVLPVTVLFGIWEKKMVFQIMAFTSSLLQLIMLAGARSMTGLIGVAGGAVIAIVFLLADVKKNRFVLCGIGAAGILAVAGICLFAPAILSRFTDSAISKCSYRIASMVSSSDSLKIELDSGRTVTLTWKPGATVYEFDVVDERGNTVVLTGDAFNGAGFEGEAWNGIEMSATKKEFTVKDKTKYYDVLRITADKKYYWDFVRMDDKLWYVNRIGKLDQLYKVEHMGFEGNYDLATNRGYIWSRTLPLLKKTMFIGVGRDNFVYAFPNDDYVGKVSCGFDGQIVTKPHNMYLQIWVQDGMPACLAFLALYLVFAVRTFKRSFRKGKLSTAQKLNIALFCGATGYMAAGLANDSTICVAPIFWVLLGIGYAVNKTINKN